MRKWTLPILLLSLFAWGAWDTIAVPAASYTIKLSRPAKMGDRYTVTLKGRQYKKEQATAVNSGSVLSANSSMIDVELVAVAEVQSINDRLQPSRISYVIERCITREQEKTKELVPKGRLVVVEIHNGNTQFTIDGKSAKKKTEEALRIVISLSESGMPDDDQIWGTKEQKRIGDVWGVNKEAAALGIKQMGFKVQPSDVSGIVKLSDMRKEAGIDVIELSSRITFSNVKVPLPVPASDKSMQVEAQFWGLFPVDSESTQRIAESSMTSAAFSGRVSQPGMDILYEMAMEEAVERKYEPVK